jgi:hypothetical protein
MSRRLAITSAHGSALMVLGRPDSRCQSGTATADDYGHINSAKGRIMKMPSAFVIAAIVASFPSVANAQAHVTQIVVSGDSALDSTDAVELIQLGSVEPSGLKSGADLELGSELRARNDSVTVVLACSDTADVTLHARFRVVIMPAPEGKVCFVDLLAGSAYAMGDATELGAGDVTMGAKRTHYHATVSRSRDSVQSELEVFDGEVEVHSGSLADSVAVPAGSTLAVVNGRATRGWISEAQFAAAARLYARVDASRAKPDARPAVAESLTVLYRRVFTHPDSAVPRLDLIARQLEYGTASKATLYHIQRVRQIERAKPLSLQSSKLEETTKLLSVATYSELGEEAKADTQYAGLQSHDPQTLNEALTAFRIDPDVINRVGRLDARAALGHAGALPGFTAVVDSLRVTAKAVPALIHPGASASVVVTVTDRAGRPVSGATVKVSAGGGAFAGDGRFAQGQTDANGWLKVVWSCGSCAPSYGFSVTVAKQGFATVAASTRLRVR